MRNLKCYAALPVFLSLILVLNTCLHAQNKTLDRKYDPVIVSADALSGFKSSDFEFAAIDQIYAMIYNGTSQGWQMIPFQIDERDTSGSYFTDDQVAGFDENDELVFMAADAGDSAIGWVNNADSEQYQRFAIKITDPLSREKKAGFIYIVPARYLHNLILTFNIFRLQIQIHPLTPLPVSRIKLAQKPRAASLVFYPFHKFQAQISWIGKKSALGSRLEGSLYRP